MDIAPDTHDHRKFWKLVIGLVAILLVLVIIDAVLLYFKTTVPKVDTSSSTTTSGTTTDMSANSNAPVEPVKTYNPQQQLQVLVQKTGQKSATTTDPQEFEKHRAALEEEMKILDALSKKK